MKRSALSLLGFVTACGGGGTGAITGTTDASSDTGVLLEASTETGALDASSDAPAADAACADAGSPPSTLACTGLFADFAAKEVSANSLPYTPATPLWSDGAQKARWIV